MAGTKEGGEKAAASRGHESLSEAGRKGGQASSGHKTMETRARNEGKSVHDVDSEMGQKGGQQGGRARREEDEE